MDYAVTSACPDHWNKYMPHGSHRCPSVLQYISLEMTRVKAFFSWHHDPRTYLFSPPYKIARLCYSGVKQVNRRMMKGEEN